MKEPIARLSVDSSRLWDSGIVEFSLNSGALYNCQVIRGSGQWPTPCEIGIYFDAEDDMCAIVDWTLPCTPKVLKTEFGVWVIHLDSASEQEILEAESIEVDFFRNR